jgi:pilus assembly protein CpaC
MFNHFYKVFTVLQLILNFIHGLKPLGQPMFTWLRKLRAHSQVRGISAHSLAHLPLVCAGVLGASHAMSQSHNPEQKTWLIYSGQSQMMTLPRAVERVSVANPAVAEVMLLGSRELYVLGKNGGKTNLIMWTKGSPPTMMDVHVHIDVSGLKEQLAELMPQEKNIEVRAAGDSIVLSGTVSSVLKAERAFAMAQAYVGHMMHAYSSKEGGKKDGNVGVVNLMQIAQPQQVMLEVKVAEISRSLLDQFGISLDLSRTAGSMTYTMLTSSLQEVFGRLRAKGPNGSVTIDAKVQDGLVKVLAEPNIIAMSGQEGSFLAGGKVFIPVARDNAEGRPTITLEEKEFGVGLKFTPLVLDDDVVQLRVAPEVSEITKTGSPFVTNAGATSVLPSFTTRRASTTVQLRDGQTLAIAGLIKNNVTENISKFPLLGDIPVLGALFRSVEFQTDRSELLFIITPRMVKALPPNASLPTDGFVPPNPVQRLLNGQLEGNPKPTSP